MIHLATPMGLIGFGQSEIDFPTQDALRFATRTDGSIVGAEAQTEALIAQMRDDINSAFGAQIVPIAGPDGVSTIDPGLVRALQELARAASGSSEVTEREAAAVIASNATSPTAVRDNFILLIREGTAPLSARFDPFPPPSGLPGLRPRRESALGLAGVLFLGLLTAGVGTYIWIKRPWLR